MSSHVYPMLRLNLSVREVLLVLLTIVFPVHQLFHVAVGILKSSPQVVRKVLVREFFGLNIAQFNPHVNLVLFIKDLLVADDGFVFDQVGDRLSVVSLQVEVCLGIQNRWQLLIVSGNIRAGSQRPELLAALRPYRRFSYVVLLVVLVEDDVVAALTIGDAVAVECVTKVDIANTSKVTACFFKLIDALSSEMNLMRGPFESTMPMKYDMIIMHPQVTDFWLFFVVFAMYSCFQRLAFC